MPLPVLHSFAGYAVYKAADHGREPRSFEWRKFLLFALLANLADFDFLPGILVKNAFLFHRGISHSLGAAVICGMFVGFIWIVGAPLVGARDGRGQAPPLRMRLLGDAPTTTGNMLVEFLRILLWTAAAYYSHVILDCFTGPAYGVPAFWPLTSERFSFSFALLPSGSAHVHSVTSLTEFIKMLFSLNFITHLLFEVALIAFLLSFVSFIRSLHLERKLKISEGLTLASSGSTQSKLSTVRLRSPS